MMTAKAGKYIGRIALGAAAFTAVFLAALASGSCAPAHATASDATVATELPADTGLPRLVDTSSFWRMTDDERHAVALLASMSDVERLGQLFMLSYGGDEPTGLLLSWIRERGLGGVKIFGWNGEDTSRLASAISTIQEAAEMGPHDVPPFIATDQEGGWVRHVKGGTSITPGNMAIGASAWPSDAYRSALYIGRELSALGITMNFAPTVDLATRPDSPIIGSRAFSSDPAQTAVLAAAWARGMADAGVAATAKHFPGHGDTVQDSHGVLPIMDVDEATLWDRELVPYRLLAAEGVPGVMSGHLAFPAITGSNEPASLSSRIIQGILRDRVGYDGLVITDDLMMNGAWSPGGLAQTCERAIRAGNDILEFSRTLGLNDAEWSRLLYLYRSDPGFRARVDESALRVIKAKLRWLLPRGHDGIRPVPDPVADMRTPESRMFFQEQAYRSATLLGSGNLPARTGERVLLAGQFSDFFAEGSRIFTDAESFRFAYLPGDLASEDELAMFRSRLARTDSVVLCIANPASATFAREAVKAGKRLYVVSVLSPFFAAEFAASGLVVAVYSYTVESFRAAFAVLAGQLPGTGRLPLMDKDL